MCHSRTVSTETTVRLRESSRIVSRALRKFCSSWALSASQSAMQELVNLGCNGARLLDQAAVDEFADHDFSLERIALAMLRFGFGSGRDRGLEAWIAATIGPQFAQRLAEVLRNVVAATAHVVVQCFVNELVHRPLEHFAQGFEAVLQGRLETNGGRFVRHAA